jgi:hypothetical protein
MIKLKIEIDTWNNKVRIIPENKEKWIKMNIHEKMKVYKLIDEEVFCCKMNLVELQYEVKK